MKKIICEAVSECVVGQTEDGEEFAERRETRRERHSQVQEKINSFDLARTD